MYAGLTLTTRWHKYSMMKIEKKEPQSDRKQKYQYFHKSVSFFNNYSL